MVAIFAASMSKGIPPTIFGDGSSTRDYLFVEDAIAANLLVLTCGDWEIYHVSTGQHTSLNELFCRLKRIIGSITARKDILKMSPVYAEPRLGEIHRIALSLEKIRRDLGWTPKISPRRFGTNRSVLPFAGVIVNRIKLQSSDVRTRKPYRYRSSS